MPCENVPIALDGPERTPVFATVCGVPAPRRRRCVGCGKLTNRLCDVTVGGSSRGGRSVTCDAPVCPGCTVRLGDADVCPAHAVPDEALAAATGLRR